MTEDKINEDKSQETNTGIKHNESKKEKVTHEVKHEKKNHEGKQTKKYVESHSGSATKNNDAIHISKVALWQIISAVLVIALVASLYTGGFGGADGDNVKTASKVTSEESAGDGTGLMDDDSIKGDPNAPVTIIEWSDFECPYCARFYEQAYQQIVSEYVDTGKVKLVFRDFPLSFHKNAQKAAEAAECAGEQGSFYDMHDKLFEDGVSGGVTAFKKYAVDLGLDAEEFNECLDSNSMAAEVAADMQAGIDNGVRGTPGFLINGQLLSGAQPFSAFQTIIEAELAK